MSIEIWWPVINSFSLWLSRESFTIFLSLSPILISLPSWVPLAWCLFNRVRPSFDRSSHRPRQRILQPPLFLLPPFLFLRVVVWRLRWSWHSFSAWMLAVTFSVMSCVRWTLVSVVLHDDKLALVASSLLPLLLQRLLSTRMLMMVLVMMMIRRIRMLALPVMRWWRLLSDLPFVIRDKKEE